MNWTDLIAALALVLILEGILPFLNPGLMRRLWSMMCTQNDRSLRISGLVSMALGLITLFLVR